jgi:hypothetical protein
MLARERLSERGAHWRPSERRSERANFIVEFFFIFVLFYAELVKRWHK